MGVYSIGSQKAKLMQLLHDLLDIVFRRIRLIVASVAITCVGFCAYLLLMPRVFEASARLLLRSERPPISLIPQENVSASFTGLADIEMATELELISSSDVLKAAVRAREEKSEMQEAELQARVEDLQKRLKVSPVMRSSLVEVRYTDTEPKRAARVVKALTDAYLAKHLTLRGGRANYSFFEKRAEESKVAVESAQEALARFQTERGIFELATQRDQGIRRLADARAALHEAEALEAEIDRRIGVLRSQVRSEAPRIATSQKSLPDHYSVERLTTLLVELRNKRTELATKFRPDDRVIVQINKQIEDTNSALDKALQRESREQTTDLNPLRQQAELELARAEQSLRGVKARQSVLRDQAGVYESLLRKFATSAPEEAELARRVKEAEANYLLDAKKRDALRVDALLDDQKITNVMVVEPVAVPLRPKGRISTPVISLFILINASIFLAVVFAGYASTTVTTPRQLERLTGVPVIGTVSAAAGEGRRRIGPVHVESLVECIRTGRPDDGQVILFMTVGDSDSKTRVLADIAPQLSTAARGPVLAIPSSVSHSMEEPERWPELPLQQTASGLMEVVPVDRLHEQEDPALEYIWVGMRPEQFAHIMIETPPLDAVSPLPRGIQHAGHIFLVVTAGKTRRGEVTKAMRKISNTGRQVSGFVLTNRTYPIPEFLYQYL